jgi:hypothetical protein
MGVNTGATTHGLPPLRRCGRTTPAPLLAAALARPAPPSVVLASLRAPRGAPPACFGEAKVVVLFGVGLGR